MIGPVSETGKTMLSSLQGAMAKGMPVDQAIQYVKSQAATGVAPLVAYFRKENPQLISLSNC